jgi:hypothetical protein
MTENVSAALLREWREITRGLTPWNTAKALGSVILGINYTGCTKKHMGEVYASTGQAFHASEVITEERRDKIRKAMAKALQDQKSRDARNREEAQRRAELDARREAESKISERLVKEFEELGYTSVVPHSGRVSFMNEDAQRLLDSLKRGGT